MSPELASEPSNPVGRVDGPETPGSAPGALTVGQESARKPERGECVACGRYIQLKVDGTVRHHGGPAPLRGVLGVRRTYRCPGAGRMQRQVSA